MKNKNEFLNIDIQIQEFDVVLQKIYENSNKIAEKMEFMRSDFEFRVQHLENKCQELATRLKYSRID